VVAKGGESFPWGGWQQHPASTQSGGKNKTGKRSKGAAKKGGKVIEPHSKTKNEYKETRKPSSPLIRVRCLQREMEPRAQRKVKRLKEKHENLKGERRNAKELEPNKWKIHRNKYTVKPLLILLGHRRSGTRHAGAQDEREAQT